MGFGCRSKAWHLIVVVVNMAKNNSSNNSTESEAVIAQVPVSLAERGYSIFIGAGLLDNAARYIAPVLKAPRTVIIADEALWPLYGNKLQASLLSQGIEAPHILVPSGEQSKSFSGLEKLLEQLLSLPIDRRTTLIALGGGVIGDLVGFAASIALRGVPFIQIPTTLLAQVDSSVGGKTAINSKSGKNLIGSFYQPKLVLADITTLKTLPKREMQSGYAEIIKYGLITDASFYEWCLTHGEQLLLGHVKYLRHAIATSCAMKARIVEEDEKEEGRRAWLNFGHTFAHALEAETGFSSKLLHGEAVALGMVLALNLSFRLGLINEDESQKLARHFVELGIKAHIHEVQNNWNMARLIAHMQKDKKAEKDSLNFVVLEKIGKARLQKSVAPALIKTVLEQEITIAG